MRRLTLAALSAALVLSACGDQSPTEPNVPPPAETFGNNCTVTRFPLNTALTQIKIVFPTARLRLEASLRAGAIALLWNTCHEELAQKAALDFVKWMGRQTLPTTPAAKQAQNDLIITILTGVGLLDVPPDASGGDDFGIGLYDPTKTTPQVFETNGGTALTELLFGAFSEFTVIVISRRPDNSNPLNFEGNQFPPFFDYNAINASGNHFFENGETATIAFCQLPETEGFEYPELADIKIGHNKPTDPVEFELLDAEAVREELAARLNCDALETAFGNFGGLQNLVRATGRSLAPIARAIFMPAPLQAATTAVGYLGPISTKPGSFSPFGVVEVAPITFGSDPTWSGAQKVCLNPSNPANCPDGATLYMYEGGGWGADLSAIPGAFWIWAAGVTSTTSPAYPAEFSFSKSFSLSGLPLTGSISVAADDYAQVIVNDEVVGAIGSLTDGALAGAAQSPLTTFDIGSFLVPGTNQITVRGANGNFGCGAGQYSCNPAGVVFGGWLGQAPVIID